MKKLFCIFLIMVMSFFVTDNIVSLNVNAAEKSEISGIDISIASDKEEYASGEDANISFTIRNNSSNNLNALNWDLKIPDGLKLKNGDISGKNIRINAGEALEGSVVLVKDTATTAITTTSTTSTTTKAVTATSAKTTINNADSAKTGDYTNVCIPLTIIVIALFSAYITRKKSKKAIKFLCLLLCITCAANVNPLDAFGAEDNQTSSIVEKTIKIDNSDYKVEFSICIDSESFEVTVSNQLYAWADYNKKDKTISINWLKQKDAVSYNVYEKNTSEHALAEVKDKTEYVYKINDSDARDEYTFFIKKNAEKDRVVSNDVVLKRSKNGSYSFEDIDSDEDGLNDLKEIKLKTDRLVPDTDSDGVIDGYEFYDLRTDPLIAASNKSGISDGDDDIDGDGLSNSKEYLYSTNPFNGDTDNDGFPDGYEVSNGMEPLKFNKLSFDGKVVSELENLKEYDLEIFNLTEEYPLDILYNEDGLVKSIGGVFSKNKVLCAQDAFYAICNVRDLLGIQDPINELKYLKFNSSRNTNTYCFSLEYNGVKIYGRNIILTCDLEGKVVSLLSSYIKHDILETINTTPDVTNKKLIEIINTGTDNNINITDSDLYIKYDDEALLVYRIETNSGEVIWINAHSGEIIDRYSQTSSVNGLTDTQKGEDGKEYEFPVTEHPISNKDYDNDVYFMYDEDKKIALYNINKEYNKIRNVPDLFENNNNIAYSYDYDRDYDYYDEFYLDEAVSTFYNTIQVYDWYAKNGYPGLDGNNAPVPVCINDPSLERDSLDPEVDGNGEFRIYDKKSGDFSGIYLGPHSKGKKSEGSFVELIGHEYGHAFFANKINVDEFDYNGTSMENKTINEAYADIFGSCVKGQWASHNIPLRNIPDPHSSGNPIKVNDSELINIEDPEEACKLIQAAAYDKEFTEPHRNSTVISHAAYLMNNKYGVDMEDIWTLFSNSVRKMGSDTGFDDIREILVLTARDESFNNKSNVISALGLALNDVGILAETGSAKIAVEYKEEPASNASVKILKSGNVVKEKDTDSNGVATFDDLEIGTYDIKVVLNDGRYVLSKITIKPNVTESKKISITAGSTDFDWLIFDHENYKQKIGPTEEKHIDIGDTEIVMTGYTEDPIKDFLLTHENDKADSLIHSQQKTISFSIEKDEDVQSRKYKNDWHTLEGGGFLFDVSITGQDEENVKSGTLTAHCILVTPNGLKLYNLLNVDIAQFSDGKIGNLINLDNEYPTNSNNQYSIPEIKYNSETGRYEPMITKLSEKSYDIGNVQSEHNFMIRIDKSTNEYITIWDNDKVIVDNLRINKLSGDDFGPITSHDSHYCSQVSKFTFSDININLVSVSNENGNSNGNNNSNDQDDGSDEVDSQNNNSSYDIENADLPCIVMINEPTLYVRSSAEIINGANSNVIDQDQKYQYDFVTVFERQTGSDGILWGRISRDDDDPHPRWIALVHNDECNVKTPNEYKVRTDIYGYNSHPNNQNVTRTLTDREWKLLCNAVNSEARGVSNRDQKAFIVEEILNQLKLHELQLSMPNREKSEFKGTIEEILIDKFEGSTNYTGNNVDSYFSSVTSESIDAVEYFLDNQNAFNHFYIFNRGDGNKNYFGGDSIYFFDPDDTTIPFTASEIIN